MGRHVVVLILFAATCVGGCSDGPSATDTPAPAYPDYVCKPHPVDDVHPTGVSCTNPGGTATNTHPQAEGLHENVARRPTDSIGPHLSNP